jgi:hypothetical protein
MECVVLLGIDPKTWILTGIDETQKGEVLQDEYVHGVVVVCITYFICRTAGHAVSSSNYM